MLSRLASFLTIWLVAAVGAAPAPAQNHIANDGTTELSHLLEPDEDQVVRGQDGCEGDAASWNRNLFTEVELLFLKYHRGDGVRIGVSPGESTAFDFNTSPRFTLGTYLDPCGLGARVRYWEYDQFTGVEGLPAGNGFGIDTCNVDLELFEEFGWGPRWSVEISGGVRYNQFEEAMINFLSFDRRQIEFEGWGLMAGAEAKRTLRHGALYARVRGAALLGDKRLFNYDGGVLRQDNTLSDTVAGVIEFGVGYEARREFLNGAELFGRIGAEVQHWPDYSSSFGTDGDVPDEDVFVGPASAGFAGFVLSVGVRR